MDAGAGSSGGSTQNLTNRKPFPTAHSANVGSLKYGPSALSSSRIGGRGCCIHSYHTGFVNIFSRVLPTSLKQATENKKTPGFSDGVRVFSGTHTLSQTLSRWCVPQLHVCRPPYTEHIESRWSSAARRFNWVEKETKICGTKN